MVRISAGYADLCRVYTTPTLYSAFREIALAMEDLRADLDLMADTKKTPLDFGLRVRTPQDGLVITSANKIAAAIPSRCASRIQSSRPSKFRERAIRR